MEIRGYGLVKELAAAEARKKIQSKLGSLSAASSKAA
jgi:hypothetical protein